MSALLKRTRSFDCDVNLLAPSEQAELASILRPIKKRLRDQRTTAIIVPAEYDRTKVLMVIKRLHSSSSPPLIGDDLINALQEYADENSYEDYTWKAVAHVLDIDVDDVNCTERQLDLNKFIWDEVDKLEI